MQKAGALDADDVLILCFQSYIVKTPHHTILVDSCIGNDKPRPLRPKWNMKTDDTYMRALAAAGFSVGDIDFVMCTHLHVDHVGWNTRLENGRWVPTFPNARYVFGKSEFDYWTEQNAKAACRRSATACCRSSKPNGPRSCATIMRSAITSRILPTPGHTPGHVAFTFGRGKDDAVFSGDLMHSPLQTHYPELSAKFDVDQAAGGSDAAQLPGALLRHRHAVLHRAFPLALDRQNPPPRQWIFCEVRSDCDGLSAIATSPVEQDCVSQPARLNRTNSACD